MLNIVILIFKKRDYNFIIPKWFQFLEARNNLIQTDLYSAIQTDWYSAIQIEKNPILSSFFEQTKQLAKKCNAKVCDSRSYI